jgi:hypothetical protein
VERDEGLVPELPALRLPDRHAPLQITLGKSTTRDEDYEIEYSDRGLMDEKAFILAKFLYERDSTERFLRLRQRQRRGPRVELHGRGPLSRTRTPATGSCPR